MHFWFFYNPTSIKTEFLWRSRSMDISLKKPSWQFYTGQSFRF